MSWRERLRIRSPLVILYPRFTPSLPVGPGSGVGSGSGGGLVFRYASYISSRASITPSMFRVWKICRSGGTVFSAIVYVLPFTADLPVSLGAERHSLPVSVHR